MKSYSLPEQCIADVFKHLAPNVLTAVGERELAANAGTPRVVAVPKGSPTIDMTDRPGGEKFTRPDGSSYRMRRLLLRRFEIEFHCHGAPDFDSAEKLLIAVIIGARMEFHHSVKFASEIWVDQQDGNDGYEKNGSVIVVTCIIDIPVWDEPNNLIMLSANPPIDTASTLLPPNGDP